MKKHGQKVEGIGGGKKERKGQGYEVRFHIYINYKNEEGEEGEENEDEENEDVKPRKEKSGDGSVGVTKRINGRIKG